MATAAVRHYNFVAKNEKTAHGYVISFVNIPAAQAVGATYEEAVYYSYRVLSDFLAHLPADEVALTAYTLADIPDATSQDVFYSLVSVTPDFDPHKMTTHFTLPQTPPAEIRRKASKLAKLVARQKHLAEMG